jgi:hypothetical protein
LTLAAKPQPERPNRAFSIRKTLIVVVLQNGNVIYFLSNAAAANMWLLE